MAAGKMETRKPAIQVITGSEAAKSAIPRFAGPLNPNPENLPTKGKATATSKPAIAVITDFGVGLSGKEPENSKVVGSASTCEPYREIIELGLSRDRNAMAIWQLLRERHSCQIPTALRPWLRPSSIASRNGSHKLMDGTGWEIHVLSRSTPRQTRWSPHSRWPVLRFLLLLFPSWKGFRGWGWG